MASVTLRGRFAAGTKVELRERRADFYSDAAKLVARGKVSRDGDVTFKDLPEGGRYWVAAEVDGVVRSAMVTAKVPAPEKERTERPSAAEARPPERASGPTVKRASRSPRELSERLAQRDVPASVVQRSATPLGVATPKDPREVVPALPQSEVPKGVVQRSDTPLGAAAVKPVGDEPPAVRQEDARGRQRSDTPTGAAKRKPAVGSRRAAVKAAKDRDAERSQKALREGAQKAPARRKKAPAKGRRS